MAAKLPLVFLLLGVYLLCAAAFLSQQYLESKGYLFSKAGGAESEGVLQNGCANSSLDSRQAYKLSHSMFMRRDGSVPGNYSAGDPHTWGFARVYDCFLFSNELEVLKIRLTELEGVADYFIVAEADHSFQPKPKPLHFQENAHLFERWAEQIIHVVIPNSNSSDSWEREYYFRNAVLRLGLHEPSHRRARPGDILILSDVDEIPSAAAVAQLKLNPKSFPMPAVFDLQFFYYSYEYQIGTWSGPWIDLYRSYEDSAENAQWMRIEAKKYKIKNAGWHCSYCFGNISGFVDKFHTYAHVEFSGPYYTNATRIFNVVRDGEDPVERGSNFSIRIFRTLGVNLTAPYLVLKEPEKYPHLLKRRQLPTAGFGDLEEHGIKVDGSLPFEEER